MGLPRFQQEVIQRHAEIHYDTAHNRAKNVLLEHTAMQVISLKKKINGRTIPNGSLDKFVWLMQGTSPSITSSMILYCSELINKIQSMSRFQNLDSSLNLHSKTDNKNIFTVSSNQYRGGHPRGSTGFKSKYWSISLKLTKYHTTKSYASKIEHSKRGVWCIPEGLWVRSYRRQIIC